MQAAYQVKIDGFEGPLDLLLHLVNQYEIDIYDIPVAEMTEQYMHYIHTMQQLELNVASEYLVMAATLLAIKSALLLPNQALTDDDGYEEDPREALMQRLIEYRKYKEAATELQEKESEELSSFTRAPAKIVFDEETIRPAMKGNASVYDMLAAMQKVFERKKWDNPMETTIERIEIPIKQRMEEVLRKINQSAHGIRFEALFPVASRSYIVVTFMAVLELMKDNLIYCQQENTFDQLILHKRED